MVSGQQEAGGGYVDNVQNSVYSYTHLDGCLSEGNLLVCVPVRCGKRGWGRGHSEDSTQRGTQVQDSVREPAS